MKTILVSGASGIVGYGTLKSLRSSRLPLRLIGTSIYSDSVAPAFCDQFKLAPHTDDAGYLPWLLKTIEQHDIDLLIAGIEIDMYFWVEHRAEIEANGAQLLMNNPSLISLCKDKWAFFQSLRSAGLACVIDSSITPDYDHLVQHFGLPFLLKPRRGFGSKGIVHIHDRSQFAQYREAIGQTLMAQPIVGSDDEEYTCSAFCDGAGGLHARMTLRRRLSHDGYTEKATVTESTPFDTSLTALCRHLQPVGPTNFQFRLTPKGPKLLEINPRISSSTSIRTAFGYNESAMSVQYLFEGLRPEQPTIRSGRAVRYTEDCVFYEDSVHL
jgi:carbamoyl-phosphate synthase large subunit